MCCKEIHKNSAKRYRKIEKGRKGERKTQEEKDRLS
jgi:hypothetical protein